MPKKKYIFTSDQVAFVEFLKSDDFVKAMMMGIALTIPVLLGIYYDALDVGVTVTIGVMLGSPSDVSGNLRRNLIGVSLSTLLGMNVVFLAEWIQLSPYILYPGLGVLVFVISYLSIYGFRASLISFSGLFAIMLSFSTVSDSDFTALQRSLLIGVGGAWYLLWMLIRHLVMPLTSTENFIAQTFELTASYIETRGEIIDKKSNRKALAEKLLSLQTELTENHEYLRELLMVKRKRGGKSTYQSKRLLVFSQLLDMFELAMANAVNYEEMDKFIEKHPRYLQDFQLLLFSMANRLREISDMIIRPRKLKSDVSIQKQLDKLMENLNKVIERYQDELNDEVLLFKNNLKYQEEQYKKIQKIEWIFKHPTAKDQLHLSPNELQRFITKNNYNLNLLIDNFTLQSNIFRHSLRIALVSMVGYGIGEFFDFQNSYWILLTIFVIMRPTYGLTKMRFKHRTLGTIIGGVFAVGIVFIVHNPVVYGILAVVSMVAAFSMFQKNYRIGATFVTLSVVFIYALMVPNVLDIIQYRITDTLIGAALAASANLLLWPAWEIGDIEKMLYGTIRANRKYLEEIATFYNDKENDKPNYKLARKEAFLSLSDLSASFQRMTQEPKRQRKNLNQVYSIVMLNNTFLASLASLSRYIINNPTTPATPRFNLVVEQIQENLLMVEKMLKKEISTPETIPTDEVFKKAFGQSEITQILKSEQVETGNNPLQIEEAHLILQQLRWMLDMSKKMVTSTELLIDHNGRTFERIRR